MLGCHVARRVGSAVALDGSQACNGRKEEER